MFPAGRAVPFVTWGSVTSGMALWDLGAGLAARGYGLLGAALAALWLIALAAALEPWLLQLARLYGSGFQLVGLTTEELGGLLGGGTLLGLLGAWIGAARHLSRIEPRQ